MRKKELEELYKEVSTKRKMQMPKYLQILKTYFPIEAGDPKERFVSDYIFNTGLDREFAEEMYEFTSTDSDDVRSPKSSFTVWKLFKEYLYENKQGIAKEDKEFILRFINTLTAFSTLDNAFKNNNIFRYIDSPFIEFKNEDIVITDPCYVVKDEDWGKSNYGCDLKVFNVTNYLTCDTLYGDWSCTVFNLDEDRKPIGEFCADAGLVSVLSLGDVIEKINPNFERWAKDHDWCVTIIKNFTGFVQIKTAFNSFTGEIYAYVSGSGSINFVGEQTGY